MACWGEENDSRIHRVTWSDDERAAFFYAPSKESILHWIDHTLENLSQAILCLEEAEKAAEMSGNNMRDHAAETAARDCELMRTMKRLCDLQDSIQREME